MSKNNIMGMGQILDTRGQTAEKQFINSKKSNSNNSELDDEIEQLEGSMQNIINELSINDNSDDEQKDTDQQSNSQKESVTQSNTTQNNGNNKQKQNISKNTSQNRNLNQNNCNFKRQTQIVAPNNMDQVYKMIQNPQPLQHQYQEQTQVSYNTQFIKRAEGNKDINRCLKYDLIDDIEELKLQLKEERVNINFLPEITEETHLSALNDIKNILRKKVKKQQSNSIVEDVIFMLLKGVETVFNGKFSIGGIKPNLKGLSKSVSLKLQNQKQQFTEVIENFCKKHKIGSSSKIIVQIIISAIKRNFLNKDKDQLDDRSDNLAQLKQLYSQS